jgi:hypothetical protein
MLKPRIDGIVLTNFSDVHNIQLESLSEPCEFGFEVIVDTQIKHARKSLHQFAETLIVQQKKPLFQPHQLWFEVLLNLGEQRASGREK